MNIDDETLLLLLSGGHISISDRKELGIWPHVSGLTLQYYSMILSRCLSEFLKNKTIFQDSVKNMPKGM